MWINPQFVDANNWLSMPWHQRIVDAFRPCDEKNEFRKLFEGKMAFCQSDNPYYQSQSVWLKWKATWSDNVWGGVAWRWSRHFAAWLVRASHWLGFKFHSLVYAQTLHYESNVVYVEGTITDSQSALPNGLAWCIGIANTYHLSRVFTWTNPVNNR